jgi:D-alanyl-D-alanine carboxypeptidase
LWYNDGQLSEKRTSLPHLPKIKKLMNNLTEKKAFRLTCRLFAAVRLDRDAELRSTGLLKTFDARDQAAFAADYRAVGSRQTDEFRFAFGEENRRGDACRSGGQLGKKLVSDFARTAIPGYSGVLVESLDGNVVVENYSNVAFNPASNVKIATAYAVLKTFGPDYRFPTSVWTDGAYEEATGTLHGNLYISGRDPMFSLEHGVALASELNRMGIRS